jgi:hypothetical protein
LPLEVEIKLVLNGVGKGAQYSYTTKVFLPIAQPLSFGIPQGPTRQGPLAPLPRSVDAAALRALAVGVASVEWPS